MTQLRNKMLEELQRRNYSHRTAKTYVRIVREFATYFHQPPDKLGPEQIRQYTHVPGAKPHDDCFYRDVMPTTVPTIKAEQTGSVRWTEEQ